MRAVNLLPRDEVPKSFEAKRGVVFGAAGGAALVTVALTALMLSAGNAISDHQAAVDTAKAELAAIPTAPDAAENAADDAALSAELSTRTTALSTALAGRVRLGQRAPPGVAGAPRGRLVDEPHELLRPELRDRSQ